MEAVQYPFWGFGLGLGLGLIGVYHRGIRLYIRSIIHVP